MFMDRKTQHCQDVSLGDFPGSPVVKSPLGNAGDTGSILGWEDATYRGATKPEHHNYWSPRT